jgi:2-phospho-L-lactate/phosphoenolpyruvate guanylyltransferase
LSTALAPGERRALAVENARRALGAAIATGRPVLAVCGSEEAATEARSAGAGVLLESDPSGQNAAAQRGVDVAAERGAEALLLVSSDLPLVTAWALQRLIERGEAGGPRSVVAAAATGRGGTNALYLRPPDVIGLHFGDASLAKFERDARERAAEFLVHECEELALDLDEPTDLELLARR